jgi:hypothetical protein
VFFTPVTGTAITRRSSCAALGFFADGTPRPMVIFICAGALAALLANLLLLRTAPE